MKMWTQKYKGSIKNVVTKLKCGHKNFYEKNIHNKNIKQWWCEKVWTQNENVDTKIKSVDTKTVEKRPKSLKIAVFSLKSSETRILYFLLAI